MTKKILETFTGKSHTVPPIWLMRQAGRYLPEYLETRKKAGDFWGLVYNPDLATEVTLQPVRRYGFDAAILFSDILVVPHAMGQEVRFTANHGPILGALPMPNNFSSEDIFHQKLAPVYDTVQRIKKRLHTEGYEDTVLIGFSGAPWTLACYMIEGGSSKDFPQTRHFAYAESQKFRQLLEHLVDRIVGYLSRQIDSGAEVIQIFDTWAGVLPAAEFQHWVIEPTRAIVAVLRERYPSVPIICFPKGAGWNLPLFVDSVRPNGISLDAQTPFVRVLPELADSCVIQGNLDPVSLLTGGDVMLRDVRDILDATKGRPFIFNLGHGIDKATPPEHVASLMAAVRQQIK